MIVTVTANPSEDLRFEVEEFSPGGVFRAGETQETAGGKGLNVTRVLNQLKADVVATGFLGGKNGDFIRDELDKKGIENSFVGIEDRSRYCIAVLDNKQQTEVLGPGPQIKEREMIEFFSVFSQLSKQAKVITMSGSLPRGVEEDTYRKLIDIGKREGVRVILDTSGKALEKGIKGSPEIIKPNEEEIKKMRASKISSEADLIREIDRIARLNDIETVCVSRGERGALILDRDELFEVTVPSLETVNPVGSGDAMVAGLAFGLNSGWDQKESFLFAAACGVSNAIHRETGKIAPDGLSKIMEKIELKKL